MISLDIKELQSDHSYSLSYDSTLPINRQDIPKVKIVFFCSKQDNISWLVSLKSLLLVYILYLIYFLLQYFIWQFFRGSTVSYGSLLSCEILFDISASWRNFGISESKLKHRRKKDLIKSIFYSLGMQLLQLL